MSTPLYTVAERENQLRRFLFVSTVLGKHLPIDPRMGLLAGAALALQAAGDSRSAAAQQALFTTDLEAATSVLSSVQITPASLEGPVSVIGFAETATALGHAVADAFDAQFLCHTTRRAISGSTPSLDFSEDHSHAPSQWLYDVPQHDGPVVLVDDEVSTGNTACNLIAELQAVHYREHYLCVSLIDRLGPEEHAACAARAQELGCVIEFVSLDSCRDAVLPELDGPAVGAVPETRLTSHHPVSVQVTSRGEEATLTARETMLPEDRTHIRSQAQSSVEQLLAQHPEETRWSILGFGEFMYFPMLVAHELTQQGHQVQFWTTTRSPIRVADQPGYPINAGITFPLPEEPETRGYLYSTDKLYGTVVLCPETAADHHAADPLYAQLHTVTPSPLTVLTPSASS
jgi:adenine/guanine phosphoribosyltransferase-like PRPP-binding protein